MADRLTIILNFKSHDGTESEVPQTYLTVERKGNHLEKKLVRLSELSLIRLF
jgi:hypothetical protein